MNYNIIYIRKIKKYKYKNKKYNIKMNIIYNKRIH